MVPGDVFRWEAFDLQKGPGEDKPRWFVYLGTNGTLFCVQILYSFTTTSQTQYYQRGGERSGHRFVEFEPAPKSPFLVSCVVDIDFDRHDLSESYYKLCAENITPMGRINDEKLLEIWRLIETSKRIPVMVIKDIRRCLDNYGLFRR